MGMHRYNTTFVLELVALLQTAQDCSPLSFHSAPVARRSRAKRGSQRVR